MLRWSIALLLLVLAAGLLLMGVPENRARASQSISSIFSSEQSNSVNQAKPNLQSVDSADVVSEPGTVVSETVPTTPTEIVIEQPQPVIVLPRQGEASSPDTLLFGEGSFGSQTMVEPMESDPIGIQVMHPDFEIPEYIPDEGRGADSARGAGTLPDPHPIVYGVNFISSAEEPADQQRYNNGKATGATWNRFPFYWHLIEENPNQFNYSRHDELVRNDVRNGLIDNAILMGIPGFYFRDGDAVPNTLYEPIFSDGTDIPGPGKQINDNNKWARYVFRTVDRFRPGGVLARQEGWNGQQGIRQWALWNEPDLTWFWDGTKTDYARLLKVGYFAVNQADPQAQVIFGALANNFDELNYYKDVLTILRDDTRQPRAQDHNYFHDILATHSYYYPWQSWYHVFRAKNVQGQFGIPDNGVWLDETGMSAWDDYPGPVWDRGSWYRGTMEEQAGYTIMTSMYALYAGADAIFHFQLYDACGNQPQGNDFPPHTGNLCTGDKFVNNTDYFCSGDANGLYRNPRDAICFKQHPQPETPRPNFTAYKLVTQYLQDIVPLKRWSVCTHYADDGQEWMGFYRPNTNQRIIGLWSCDDNARTAAIPAVDTGALLISADGTKRFIAPAADGKYYINLPGATNQNYPNPNGDFWPVPGSPYMLIERDLERPYGEIWADPKTNNSIWVGWFGDDGMGAGIASFDVKVSVDGGPQQNWLSFVTHEGQEWSGSYQHGVEFTIFARDYGGNVSPGKSVLVGSRPPSGPTATPWPTNTPWPTRTPWPTATRTPWPTSTTRPGVSTSTPGPTNTPWPTATRTPWPTSTPRPGGPTSTPRPTTIVPVATATTPQGGNTDEPLVTIITDGPTVNLLENVRYEIRIVNTSSRALSAVEIRSELPWQTDYVPGSVWASKSSSDLSVQNDVMTWSGSLDPNETVTLGFRALARFTNGVSSVALNRVTVNWAGGMQIMENHRTTIINAAAFTEEVFLPIVIK